MKAQLIAAAVASLIAATSPAPAEQPLRLGVANDTSGPYAAIGGTGSVLAAQMAAEALGGRVLGRRIEILSGDTQNKPDVALGFVREWYDTQGVTAVFDGAASSVGLAIQGLAQQRNKLFLNSGGTSSEFVGKSCTPTTLQFVPNTRALSVAGLRRALRDGVDTWFFLTADYAFGHALQRDATAIIEANGGKVLGAAKHPLATSDMSSYLAQARASGAKGLALANAGTDVVNSIKQAREFGMTGGAVKIVGLLVQATDLEALGPDQAEGLQFSTAFFPAMSGEALDWSRRFTARHGGHPPTMVQAMSYSATLHYLKALQALGTDDNAKVAAWLHGHRVDAILTHDAAVRPDGRVMNDLYVVRVKAPAEITDPLDNLRVLTQLPADELYPGSAESACPLFRHEDTGK
jgi:branched-chain amino acid transport system substrate-binding protein